MTDNDHNGGPAWCGECGIRVQVRAADGKAFHADELPKGVAAHDAVAVYAEPEPPADDDDGKTAFERQADALEDIADSLRKIVAKLYA